MFYVCSHLLDAHYVDRRNVTLALVRNTRCGGSHTHPCCGTMRAMTTRLVGSVEAAEALGVSPATLQRWARDGTVKPVYTTPGGKFRWNVEDLKRQLGMPPTEGPG